MAAKYLMFRNAGVSTTSDSGNSGAGTPIATSACWPVSSFLGGNGRYVDKGSGHVDSGGTEYGLQMYVTLRFKPQRTGGVAGSNAQALLSDTVELWLNDNDGYRAFLEQLFVRIEDHDSPVLNVYDSRRTNDQTDIHGIGGRNIDSVAGIYAIKITEENT